MQRNEGTSSVIPSMPRVASWEDGSDCLNLEIGGATGECPRIARRRNGIRDRDSRRYGRVFSALQPRNCVDCNLSQGTVSSKEMSGNEDTHLLYRQCHILLFYFIFPISTPTRTVHLYHHHQRIPYLQPNSHCSSISSSSNSLSPPQLALFVDIIIIKFPISTPTRTVRRYLHHQIPYLHPNSHCSSISSSSNSLSPPQLALFVDIFRRWYRWCNGNRIAFAILWIALGSFVFARCGGYKKAQDFTRAGHRMVQSTLLLSFFCITGVIQARTFIRRIHHNEVEQDTF